MKKSSQKTKHETDAGRPALKLSRTRRRWFAAICLLLPFLLIGLTEVILRLGGFGGYPPILRKVGQTDGGSLVISDQAGTISWFFANPTRPGYNDQYSFLHPKPEGVFRIFLVGESAIKGYPQPRNLAASAFLREMLRDAWPDRTVEVINLGTTAVASYPVLEIMTEALDYEPDLIVIHTGHNEFFGAYGVGSINRAGSRPWMLKTTRAIRSLALVQGVSRLMQKDDKQENRTLMEIMVGRSYTAPNDPLRIAAANNLGRNIGAMLERCARRGVPAIVCTLPSNERDLAPVGEDRLDHLSPADREKFARLLAGATDLAARSEASAMEKFTEALAIHPDHARARFEFGNALYAAGKFSEAAHQFTLARDLDSMPWRATSLQQDAIRSAAAEHNAPLCDLERVFRDASPGGCIGWELMDDHVHPSLHGQALTARTIVETLGRLSGPLAVTPEAMQRLRPWKDYAAELGDNTYDRYAVAHSMRVLFSVPFMRDPNPQAFDRFQQQAALFESTLSPAMRETVREWQSEKPHAGGKRPITGMIARTLMREKKYAEAMELFRIARKSVPEYTSWHMEYVYFDLACREKLNGSLTESEKQMALDEINQGRFLLNHGYSVSGLTERYIGRLYQLRGEFTEAIPFLDASRAKLGGFDLVAADQALFMSYVKTGQRDKARALAENGVAHSGHFADFYRRMIQVLDQGGNIGAGTD